MKVICVNGIKTDGDTTTKRFASELRKLGYETVEVDFPEVSVIGSRSRSRQRRNAQYIVDIAEDGDILVCHSYGCLLGLRSMEMGCKFSIVIFYAPAMNRDYTFPHHGMDLLYVIHNPSDIAIKWGDRLFFGHDFGEMGSKGYDKINGVPDNRVRNQLDATGVEGKLNHSHYFFWVNLPRELNNFVNKVKAYVQLNNPDHKWVEFVQEKLPCD